MRDTYPDCTLRDNTVSMSQSLDACDCHSLKRVKISISDCNALLRSISEVFTLRLLARLNNNTKLYRVKME